MRRALWHQEHIKLFNKYSGLAALFFTVFYGLVDEFHQKFIPGRTSDINDVIADTVGGLLYLLVFWFLSRKKVVAEPTE